MLRHYKCYIKSTFLHFLCISKASCVNLVWLGRSLMNRDDSIGKEVQHKKSEDQSWQRLGWVEKSIIIILFKLMMTQHLWANVKLSLLHSLYSHISFNIILLLVQIWWYLHLILCFYFPWGLDDFAFILHY